MARAPGDGKRYLTRRGTLKATADEPSWTFLESVLGSLNEDARAEIRFANDLYAFVAPQHDPRKTLLLSEILPLLRDWIDASDRLRSKITTDVTHGQGGKKRKHKDETVSRANVMLPFYGRSNARRIGKMLPLEFLDLVATAAIDAASVVTKELSESPMAVPIELWKTWVALIADSLKTKGMNVSASLRKTNANQQSSGIIPEHYSPFLRAVVCLQQVLPSECRRIVSDETLVKDVQKTFRDTSHLSRKDLIAVLAGYGPGLLGSLPNGLGGLEPDQESRIRLMLGTASSVDQPDSE